MAILGFVAILVQVASKDVGAKIGEVSVNIENCGPESPDETFFHKGMFYPGESLEMRSLSQLQPIEVIGKASLTAYLVDARLKQRFFISEDGAFRAPLRRPYFMKEGPGPYSKLKPQFLSGLIRQMEEAIDKGYAHWVSYVDMGHVHLNLPKKVLNEEVNRDKLSLEDYQSSILAHPEVLGLYHVSEKIDFYQGSDFVIPEQQSLFLSRNLLGKPYENKDLEVVVATEGHRVKANTYSLPEEGLHKEAGESIYFQGNKKGCFQLETKNGSVNFDMSFLMPDSDPEAWAAGEGK